MAIALDWYCDHCHTHGRLYYEPGVSGDNHAPSAVNCVCCGGPARVQLMACGVVLPTLTNTDFIYAGEVPNG